MIRKLLELSTAHVTPQTNTWLNEHMDDPTISLTYYPLDYGWLIHVIPKEMDSEMVSNLPADLQTCIQKARRGNCSWIILDSDAEEQDGLPTDSKDWDAFDNAQQKPILREIT